MLIQLNDDVLYSSWLITVLFVYKDLYSVYKMYFKFSKCCTIQVLYIATLPSSLRIYQAKNKYLYYLPLLQLNNTQCLQYYF